jgi:gas vesicle protein
MGVMAGVAAKIIYDNKEEVTEILKDKAKCAKEELTNLVDYASDKVSDIGEEIGKKASEYADYAKEQLQEIKENLKDDDVYTFPANSTDDTGK